MKNKMRRGLAAVLAVTLCISNYSTAFAETISDGVEIDNSAYLEYEYHDIHDAYEYSTDDVIISIDNQSDESELVSEDITEDTTEYVDDADTQSDVESTEEDEHIHDFVNWISNYDGTHYGTCDCGETVIEGCSFTGSVCTVCNFNEEHDHLYSYSMYDNAQSEISTNWNDGYHKKTCDICHETIDEKCTIENSKCIYCGYEQPTNVDYLEQTVDKYVISASGCMPAGAVLSVEPIYTDYTDILTKEAEMYKYEQLAAFDIKILVNNQEWQPIDENASVQIVIKNIDDADEQIFVHRIEEDEITNMEAIEVNDEIVFNTDHFTVYTIGSAEYDLSTADKTTLTDFDYEGAVYGYYFRYDNLYIITGDGVLASYNYGFVNNSYPWADSNTHSSYSTPLKVIVDCKVQSLEYFADYAKTDLEFTDNFEIVKTKSDVISFHSMHGGEYDANTDVDYTFDVTAFDTIDLSRFFEKNTRIKNIHLKFITKDEVNVDMSSMFYRCGSLTNVNIEFVTKDGTPAKLREVNLTSFFSSNQTTTYFDMSMFALNIDANTTINANSMYMYNSYIAGDMVIDFYGAKITDMTSICSNMSKLTSVTIKNAYTDPEGISLYDLIYSSDSVASVEFDVENFYVNNVDVRTNVKLLNLDLSKTTLALNKDETFTFRYNWAPTSFKTPVNPTDYIVKFNPAYILYDEAQKAYDCIPANSPSILVSNNINEEFLVTYDGIDYYTNKTSDDSIKLSSTTKLSSSGNMTLYIYSNGFAYYTGGDDGIYPKLNSSPTNYIVKVAYVDVKTDNLDYFFANSTNLEKVIWGKKFDSSLITSMSHTFQGVADYNYRTIDISFEGWKGTRTNLESLFENASMSAATFASLHLDGLKPSPDCNLNKMFAFYTTTSSYADPQSVFTSFDLSSLDLSHIENEYDLGLLNGNSAVFLAVNTIVSMDNYPYDLKLPGAWKDSQGNIVSAIPANTSSDTYTKVTKVAGQVDTGHTLITTEDGTEYYTDEADFAYNIGEYVNGYAYADGHLFIHGSGLVPSGSLISGNTFANNATSIKFVNSDENAPMYFTEASNSICNQYKVTTIDISALDWRYTEAVNTFVYNCTELTDIIGFETIDWSNSNNVRLSNVIAQCPKYKYDSTLDLSGWKGTENIANWNKPFQNLHLDKFCIDGFTLNYVYGLIYECDINLYSAKNVTFTDKFANFVGQSLFNGDAHYKNYNEFAPIERQHVTYNNTQYSTGADFHGGDLDTLDLSGSKFSDSAGRGNVFYALNSLKHLNITGIQGRFNIEYMFQGDYCLEDIIGLENLDISQTTHAGYMFYYTYNLTGTYDLSSFTGTENIEVMRYLANDSISMEGIIIDGWNMPNCTTIDSIVYGAEQQYLTNQLNHTNDLRRHIQFTNIYAPKAMYNYATTCVYYITDIDISCCTFDQLAPMATGSHNYVLQTFTMDNLTLLNANPASYIGSSDSGGYTINENIPAYPYDIENTPGSLKIYARNMNLPNATELDNFLNNGMTSLGYIDLSGMNAPKLTSISGFAGNSAYFLTECKTDNMHIGKLTNTYEAFENCYSLENAPFIDYMTIVGLYCFRNNYTNVIHELPENVKVVKQYGIVNNYFDAATSVSYGPNTNKVTGGTGKTMYGYWSATDINYITNAPGLVEADPVAFLTYYDVVFVDKDGNVVGTKENVDTVPIGSCVHSYWNPTRYYTPSGTAYSIVYATSYYNGKYGSGISSAREEYDDINDILNVAEYKTAFVENNNNERYGKYMEISQRIPNTPDKIISDTRVNASNSVMYLTNACFNVTRYLPDKYVVRPECYLVDLPENLKNTDTIISMDNKTIIIVVDDKYKAVVEADDSLPEITWVNGSDIVETLPGPSELGALNADGSNNDRVKSFYFNAALTVNPTDYSTEYDDKFTNKLPMDIYIQNYLATGSTGLQKGTEVHSTTEDVEISIASPIAKDDIPEDKIVYAIMVHVTDEDEGTTEVLPMTYNANDNTFTFSTKSFSTFILYYGLYDPDEIVSETLIGITADIADPDYKWTENEAIAEDDLVVCPVYHVVFVDGSEQDVVKDALDPNDYTIDIHKLNHGNNTITASWTPDNTTYTDTVDVYAWKETKLVGIEATFTPDYKLYENDEITEADFDVYNIYEYEDTDHVIKTRKSTQKLAVTEYTIDTHKLVKGNNNVIVEDLFGNTDDDDIYGWALPEKVGISATANDCPNPLGWRENDTITSSDVTVHPIYKYEADDHTFYTETSQVVLDPSTYTLDVTKLVAGTNPVIVTETATNFTDDVEFTAHALTDEYKRERVGIDAELVDPDQIWLAGETVENEDVYVYPIYKVTLYDESFTFETSTTPLNVDEYELANNTLVLGNNNIDVTEIATQFTDKVYVKAIDGSSIKTKEPIGIDAVLHDPSKVWYVNDEVQNYDVDVYPIYKITLNDGTTYTETSTEKLTTSKYSLSNAKLTVAGDNTITVTEIATLFTDTVVVNALVPHSHEYTPEVIKDPTCTVPGTTRYTCDCGDYYDMPIDPLGHIESEPKEIERVEPSTTKAGYYIVITECTRCTTELSRHTYILPILEHTHDWKDKVIKEPNCTEYGIKETYCDCGSSYQSPIDPLGHDPKDPIQIEYVDATYESDGYYIMAVYCDRCEVELSRQKYIIPKLIKDHTHSWKDKVIKNPTCTEDGIKETYCECGESYQTPIDALGHIPNDPIEIERVEPTTQTAGYYIMAVYCDRCEVELSRNKYILDKLPTPHTHEYTGKVIKEPNCTEEGIKEFTCDCGDSYQETIKALGHIEGPETEIERVEPTVNEAGYYIITTNCTRCTVELSRHKYILEKLPTPHTHVYTDKVIKEPNCTEEGIREYTCECGDSYQESIKALGHIEGPETEIERVEPTTETAGYYIVTTNCTRCTVELSRHKYILEKLPIVHVHEYTGKVIKEPTCVTEGIKEFTCECGDSYQEPIDALGHIEGPETEVDRLEPTEQSDGYYIICTYCTRPTCGVELSRHKYILEKLPHVHAYTGNKIKDPNCTEYGIMEYTCICGDSYQELIDPLGHIEGPEVEIERVEPTITTDGYYIIVVNCDRCGIELYRNKYILPKLPHVHDWKERILSYPTCTEYGMKESYCECGESNQFPIDPLGHDPKDPVEIERVEPTYTEDGYYIMAVYCNRCTIELSREKFILPKLPHVHDWKDRIIKEPNCVEYGIKEIYCECGDSYQIPIDPLGHDPKDPIEIERVEPTEKEDGYYIMAVFCNRCEIELSREKFILPKLPHVHVWTDKIIKHPNCTEDGLGRKECVCGEYSEYVIPKLGHIEGKPVEIERVEAQIDIPGYYIVCTYCDRCHVELSRNRYEIPALIKMPPKTGDDSYIWMLMFGISSLVTMLTSGSILIRRRRRH